MLAYAASRPAIAARRSSPNALLIVIGAHVALVALVMSARMDLHRHIFDPPTIVTWIPLPTDSPPPAHPVKPIAPQPPRQSTLDQPPMRVNLPSVTTPIADPTPSLPNLGELVGPGTDSGSTIVPARPARTEARLLTPPSELRPPYPQAKLLAEEEAVLKLRLTINVRGRVVAIEPAGRADPVFLDAARRYLLAHWRYQPATEDGQPIASTMLITLRFELDR